MLKFGKKTSDPQTTGDTPEPKKEEGGWFKKNQHSLIIAAILVLAFVIRFVFAYGLSAGSGYALSGGTSASEHLHTITEVLTAGTIFGADGAIHYPFGTASTNPPLIDLVLSLFAFIFKAVGMDATAAAGAALGWSSVLFGTLACIPMYLLARDILGSKKAGYLAALFLALCPIVISQTVFSNGTDIAIIAFLALFLFYFMYKGVKLLENPEEGKSPMKYSYISGIFFAIIALSYANIRPLIVVTVLCMATLVLINRFRSVDTVRVAMFFSVPILCGAIAGAAYFAAVGMLNGYIGIVLCAVLGVVFCMSFAALQKVPWTITVPVYVIAVIAVFVAMALAVPQYFNMMLTGVNFYTEGYDELISNSISFSMVATNFGFFTLWFGFMMVVYRLFKIGKNIGSATYISVLVWMIAGMLFAVTGDNDYAVIFAPTFAVGFAAVLVWVFERVDLMEYRNSFRGQNLKTIWKKIFKPLPFITVLCVVLLIGVPNVMYALDAGTANNDRDNPLNAGAIGYYVKTDSDWIMNDVFKTYSDEEKDGALVTWIDYTYDAATFGGFDVITNTLGGGSTAMSNILLSNGSDGSSVAAMLIYLVKYNGVDASKTALKTVMSEAEFDEFKTILEVVTDADREAVLGNSAEYGILRTSVSDENITYLRGINYLTETYSSYNISRMYEAVENATSKDVTYIMVSGSMFPLYYGYSSIFATMSYINGYAFSDSYGTVAQFLVTDYYTQYYTGTYAYTDVMYNTLLWRAYIGMSPTEAGLTGTYDVHGYMQNLMLSDGTYKATPGYGLGSFEVDYDHCYVSYNASKDATLSSDGWEKMLYNEAIAKQEAEGGLINYLAGYPVFLKYVNSATGTAVSGTVLSADGDPVKNVRVAVTDANGLQRSTVFTDEYGDYTVMTYGASTITYSIGTTSASGGTPISTINYTSGQLLPDLYIPETSLTGIIDSGEVDVTGALIKMVGQTTGNSYDLTVTSNDFAFADIVPDTYDITIYDASGKTALATKTYLTVVGENNGLSIDLKSAKVTVTVKDEAGNVMEGIKVALTTSNGLGFVSDETDVNGVTVINVAPGTYMYSIVTEGYSTNAAALTIEADKEETASITAIKATTAEVPVTLSGTGLITAFGYQSAYYGEYMQYPAGTAATPAFGVYTAGGFTDGSTVYFGTTADEYEATVGYMVSGKILSSESATTGTSGWVAFIDQDDAAKMVIVNSGEDGYSVLLPADTYNVYATDGSSVYYGTVNVSVGGDNTGKNFVLASSTTVSGYTYWYSSSYKLTYLPLEVTVRSGDAVYKLNVVSGTDGAYKFLVPSDATYTITSNLTEGGVYYYKGEEGFKVYTKTLESAGNFTTDVDSIKITNGNPFKIIVNDVELDVDEEKDFDVTSTSLTVKASKANGYYFSGTVAVEPAKEMTIVLGDKAVKYETIDFTVGDGITLTITADDDDGAYEAVEENKSYYFKSGHVYTVKALNEDSSKVAYVDVDLTVDEPETVYYIIMSEAIKAKGYVGFAADGTLTVNGEREYPITNGTYDIIIPAESAYVFFAEVSNDDVAYSATAAPHLTPGYTNTFNMSVCGGEKDPEPGLAEIELEITSMTDVNKGFKNAILEFTVTITAPLGAPTYVLSGGDSWRNIEFYADEEHTVQITSVNGSCVVYAVGTINADTVGQDAAGLTVIVDDINGEEMCVGSFGPSTVWSDTLLNKVIVSYGTDVINYAEYQYAIKLENKDNYTKTFTIFLDCDIADEWFATFVVGNEICETDLGAEVTVEGYATKTIYVKLSNVFGSTIDLPEIKTKIMSTEGYGLESDEEGITISGTTATVESLVMDSNASINLTASGRGVVTDKGSMPVYIWVMIAAIVLMAILLVWLGIRRGVFTRKN